MLFLNRSSSWGNQDYRIHRDHRTRQKRRLRLRMSIGLILMLCIAVMVTWKSGMGA